MRGQVDDGARNRRGRRRVERRRGRRDGWPTPVLGTGGWVEASAAGQGGPHGGAGDVESTRGGGGASPTPPLMSVADLQAALTSHLASTGELASLRARARAAAVASLGEKAVALAPPPTAEAGVALELALDLLSWHGWHHAAAVLAAEAGAAPKRPPRASLAASAGLRAPPAAGLPVLYGLMDVGCGGQSGE